MRKGLSPLVATLVLIAFTVIGGMLVYEYFTTTSENVMSSGDQLIIAATRSPLNSTRALVQLDVVNGYRTNVTIRSVSYLDRNGNTQSVLAVIGERGEVNLPSGSKYSFAVIVPANAKVLVIEYRAKDQVMRKTLSVN
ncbi:MAG: archaellin/type IV pilin N-terminal domain-containing protein [Acidilobaceae archaeon]